MTEIGPFNPAPPFIHKNCKIVIEVVRIAERGLLMHLAFSHLLKAVCGTPLPPLWGISCRWAANVDDNPTECATNASHLQADMKVLSFLRHLLTLRTR